MSVWNGSTWSRRRLAVVTVVAVLTGIGFAPTVAQTAGSDEGLTPVTVGVLGLSSSAPVFIAEERGYFRNQGLDVELRFFDAAQPIAVAAAAGDIDFGVTAFTAALLNLAGKGAIEVIAGQSRETPGYPLIAYLATDETYAAGLTEPEDLAGKRLGVTQVGSSFHYSLGLLADKYGFPLEGIEVVPLQSMSNISAAVQAGSVDAALLPVTAAQPLLDSGDAKLLGWVGDETPWQVGAVFAPTEVARNEELVNRFLDAYRMATYDYNTVLLASLKDGKAQITAETRPLLEIISKYTDLPPERLVVGLSYIDAEGGLSVTNVREQIEWFQEQGFVDRGFGVEEVINRDYVRDVE